MISENSQRNRGTKIQNANKKRLQNRTQRATKSQRVFTGNTKRKVKDKTEEITKK